VRISFSALEIQDFRINSKVFFLILNIEKRPLSKSNDFVDLTNPCNNIKCY
jgi:hypothetical protein